LKFSSIGQPADAENQTAEAEDQTAEAEDQTADAEDQTAVADDQPGDAEEQPVDSGPEENTPRKHVTRGGVSGTEGEKSFCLRLIYLLPTIRNKFYPVDDI